MIGHNENNFPHKLLLTNRQVPNLRQAFANHLSTDIKLSKAQLSKMIKSGGFLGRLLAQILKTGLLLIKNVIKLLAKSVLIPLGITASDSVADAVLHQKILRSGHNNNDNNNATLIISNNELKVITSILESLENSGLLLKGVAETVQNEVKQQKGGSFSMLLGTLSASLLGNLLTDRGVNKAGKGQGINRAGEGVLRTGYVSCSSKMDF